MRFLMRLLAPLLFRLSYLMFRSGLFQRSPRKHKWVMQLFRFAADNDSVQALSMYGHLLHFRGDGVQNRIQGGIYLQRAADKGEAKACYQMGQIFEHGFEGFFAIDPEKALHYYVAAAEQGHQLAIKRLAEAYEAGDLGLRIDVQQAQQWKSRMPELLG